MPLKNIKFLNSIFCYIKTIWRCQDRPVRSRPIQWRMNDQVYCYNSNAEVKGLWYKHLNAFQLVITNSWIFQYLQSHPIIISEFFKIHFTIFMSSVKSSSLLFFSKVQFLFSPLIGMTYGGRKKVPKATIPPARNFAIGCFLFIRWNPKLNFICLYVVLILFKGIGTLV